MKNFDPTWANAGEAQTAALDHAMKHATPFLEKQEPLPGINEFAVAKMMCIADKTLWYSQAKAWAEGGGYRASGCEVAFQVAGEAILHLVDFGYQDGEWWNARKAWKSTTAAAIGLTSILEVVRLLRLIRSQTMTVHSPWFEALPYLMIPGLDVERAIRHLGQSQARAIGVMVAVEDILGG